MGCYDLLRKGWKWYGAQSNERYQPVASRKELFEAECCQNNWE